MNPEPTTTRPTHHGGSVDAAGNPMPNASSPPPPPPPRFIDGEPEGTSRWDAVIEALRSRPGQWAEVQRDDGTGALWVAFLPRYADIEAVTRRDGDDFVLYARAVA